MKKAPFLITFSLVFTACSSAVAQSLEYPIHLSMQIESPQNAASTMIGDLWGKLVVDPDGSISGEGRILYSDISPCSWIPPYPDDGDPPYCELTGVQDGSFTISGNVIDYTGSGDEIDDAILSSHEAWGIKTAVAPRTLRITFTPNEVPMEKMNLWGMNNGLQPIETGALAMGLDAAGVFNTFEISPIIADYEDNQVVMESASYLFEGTGAIAKGFGSIFFVDDIPDYVYEEGSDYYLSF